jgi:hypothetical protein
MILTINVNFGKFFLCSGRPVNHTREEEPVDRYRPFPEQ